MHNFILATAAVVSLAAAMPARAAASAAELLNMCSTVSEDKPVSSASEAGCVVFIGGFLSGIKYGAGNAMYRILSKQGKSYKELTLAMEASRREAQCIPDSATAPQVARIFVRFAQANPQKLQQQDTTVLTEALNDQFNCVLTRSP